MNYQGLSLMVSRGIRRWKENVLANVDGVDAWLLSIVHQAPDEAETQKERCEVCSSKEDAADKELHHPGRQGFNHQTITACTTNRNCHGRLTARQRDWPAYPRECPPSTVREEYFLRGLCDLLLLKAEVTGNVYLYWLADEYIEDIRKLTVINCQYLSDGRRGGE